MRLVVKTDGGISKMIQTMHDAPRMLEDMTEAMADEAVDLVALCFKHERDPYKDKWDDKEVDDGRAILVKTGRLRRSFDKQKLGPTKFVISSSAEYAPAHQDPKPRPAWGGKALPRRAFMPYGNRGLPKDWESAFRAAIEASLGANFSIGSFGGGGGMSAIAARMAGFKRSISIRALVQKAIRQAAE